MDRPGEPTLTTLYDEDPPHDDQLEPFPEDRGPRRGRRVAAVLTALVLVLLIFLAVVVVGYQRQVDPAGPPGAEKQVLITQGTSTQGIGAILDDQGIISSARVWRLYVRIKGVGPFLAGQYTFQANSSMDDVVAVLEDGPEIEYERLTVPEGLTLAQIAERIATLDGRSKDAFLGAASDGQVRSTFQPVSVTSLEGLMLPETYNVEPTDNEAEILTRMVGDFDRIATGLGYADAQTSVGISPYEAIVVASLVERETRIDDERAKVAQVIYNRLQKGMRLQIDATVVYALGRSGTDTRVLLKDLEIDSPYNTYKRSGLPPTPIAAPGAESLRAALNPEPGPWLFYVVTEADGRHSFAVTGAEHAANIRKAEQNGVR